MRRFAVIVCGLIAAASYLGAQTAGTAKPAGTAPAGAAKPAAASAGPIMVIDTVKGTIEIQLFPADAPKSVAHIIELTNKSFYRSQRFHRVDSMVVQWGDPQSRDMTKQASWGTGSSFSPIGVIELSKRRHVRGSVALAHAGNAKQADSQLYITKTAAPHLDGKHVIIGQVTTGMTVVDKIERADLIRLVTIKEAGQK